MATNDKLSQALKGNTNAAKDHAKLGIDAIGNSSNHPKVMAGKTFASTTEKAKAAWEAVDKTVKYGAAGAAIGAANGVVGNAATSFVVKKIGTTSSAAKVYGGLSAVAGGAIGAPLGDTPKRKAIAATAVGVPVGILGAGTGAIAFKAAQAVSKVNPALRIGLSTVAGAAVGGYIGYKADRAEEATSKATGHQRQFKQV
jgi:hypothetical protein